MVGQQEHVLDATLKDCSSDVLIVSAPERIRCQRRRSPRAHSRGRRRQVKPREQHPRFKPGEDALPPKAAPYTWVVRRAPPPLCRRRERSPPDLVLRRRLPRTTPRTPGTRSTQHSS